MAFLNQSLTFDGQPKLALLSTEPDVTNHLMIELLTTFETILAILHFTFIKFFVMFNVKLTTNNVK